MYCTFYSNAQYNKTREKCTLIDIFLVTPQVMLSQSAVQPATSTTERKERKREVGGRSQGETFQELHVTYGSK